MASPYKICIDGQVLGKIARGKEIRIDVPDNSREIQLKASWCASNTIRLVNGPKEGMRFRCSNNTVSEKKAWNPFLPILYTFLWPDKYLLIESVGDYQQDIEEVRTTPSNKGKLIGTALLAGIALIVIGFILADVLTEDSDAPVAHQEIVTIEASQLSLQLEDFDVGWIESTAESTTKEGALSAYHVYYHEGSSLFPSVIQSTIVVYPTIDIAQQVYLDEKPTNISLDDPDVGNESFLDVSVPMQEYLVFRENNVVVWIWLQQDLTEDIKRYAQIVEKKI